MRSFVNVTTTRDLEEFAAGRGRPRSPNRFRRCLRAYAPHTVGVVLHTGRHRHWIDRDIEAVPIAALWGRRRTPNIA